MNHPRGAIGQRILYALILVAGVAAVAIAFRIGIGTTAQPGPGLFPGVAGVIIIAAAALQVRGLWNSAATATEFRLDRHALQTIAALLAVMALWILAIPYAGYVVVTFVAVLASARLFGLTGWRQPLMLAVFTALTVYAFFDWLLFLDLPRGIFAAGE